ncbi:MAG: kynureninase [Planctomycetota bacterium]|nr:kynureninase [Planctomycetota bacterium]
MNEVLDGTESVSYRPGREFAERLDVEDPLADLRTRFELPRGEDGEPLVYLCGNSLGLMPSRARSMVVEELEDWGKLAVEGHFESERPWYDYHELFRERGARLVGARPGEVVMMNSLTVNLHLLMVSFYRPEGRRTKVLMEHGAFPSDTYAVRSHIAARGVDPESALVRCAPREGEDLLRTEDIEAMIREAGEELALVMLGGVNFRTGQLLDMQRITAAAHEVGARAGFDLAHAAGNVPLELHDWNVDFACWCSYKYLNAGPGALAGAFVHERHGSDPGLHRFAGWWGNDPTTRFKMQELDEFVPSPGADGWQLSNPPILSAAPLLASLELCDEVGMEALSRKSRLLTGYLEYLLDERLGGAGHTVITPRQPRERGCQLSVRVHERPRERFEQLRPAGVVCDFRHPDVIRLAPVPMYTSFGDVYRTAEILGGA